MTTLDLEEVREKVDARIKEFGSKAAYARHLGIKPQQLQRSLGPGTTPDATVLADIGLTKKTVYCKKGSGDG